METNGNYRREMAEKRVEEIRGFYIHCFTYCAINFVIFCINYFLTPGRWWFYWPLIGWGIGLLMNGFATCRNGLWGEEWKERKIKKIMDRN